MRRFSCALAPVLLLACTAAAQRIQELQSEPIPGAWSIRNEKASADRRSLDLSAKHAVPDPPAALYFALSSREATDSLSPAALPESPGAVRALLSEPELGEFPQETKAQHSGAPCVPARRGSGQQAESVSPEDMHVPCAEKINPYRRFLDTTTPVLLTPKQKGYLAVRNFIDPFNLLTIAGNSAFTIGFDAHTAYGPGMAGFGRSIGYSLLQEATGESIGTFAVCSLFRQDPHYHRMPHARPMRRVVHAIGRTFIAQHDNGSLMPNYENFITYPASAEISNLYVPGVDGNGPSTVARILIGLATDPAGNLITEFLPDLAKRVHIQVVFVQQILNGVARRGDE